LEFFFSGNEANCDVDADFTCSIFGNVVEAVKSGDVGIDEGAELEAVGGVKSIVVISDFLSVVLLFLID